MSVSVDLTDIDWAAGETASVAEQVPSLCDAYFRHVDHSATPTRAECNAIFGEHLITGSRREAGTAVVRTFGKTIQIVTDDMPLLVESVSALLSRSGVSVTEIVHPIFAARRSGVGELLELSTDTTTTDTAWHIESWIYIQVHPSTRNEKLTQVRDALVLVLNDVRQVVTDGDAMRSQRLLLADQLASSSVGPAQEREDAVAVLRWLDSVHFTLLGYSHHSAGTFDGGLGVLRSTLGEAHDVPSPTGRSRKILELSQGSSPATVHRSVYPYFVSVLGGDGEHRFLGVFTVTAMHENVLDIPVIERYVRSVITRAGHQLDSFSGQAMLEVMQSYPRTELFATDEDTLFETAVAVMSIGLRRQVRLFLREDPFGLFVSALVYLPRDQYTTAIRLAIQKILLVELGGSTLDYTARVTESDLAVLHFTIRKQLTDSGPAALDLSVSNRSRIEQELATATRSWDDYLGEVVASNDLVDPVLGEQYAAAFPDGYKQDFTPAHAVADIARLEALTLGGIDLFLYRNPSSPVGSWRFALYIGGRGVSLSQVLPILQSLGVQVEDERPYVIVRADGMSCWIYDFGLSVPIELLRGSIDDDLDTELAAEARAARVGRLQKRFTDAFEAVWTGRAEADRFNELILRAGLVWRQAMMLRAYAKYLRQAGFAYSQFNIEGVLLSQPRTARLLVALFEAQFDPDAASTDRAQELDAELTAVIDGVVSLDADRILRGVFGLIRATLRTNYYMHDATGRSRECLSLKFDPQSITVLPKPRPRFEIFVYAPRVEGVHLRFGAVARGGLRWSDRREDFRTEILGLAKAQMVKNAVIVPVGAKGGFVVKRPPAATGDAAVDRAATSTEGQACYRLFIASLLDITDNLDRATSVVLPPDRVVRRDADDTYLVVAADKGTATFSDLANEVSAEYGFWLGDAFASGGSVGYDHKQMGITAKGAWESVKRHFRELGIDTQSQDFTVAGVGDMSGDVFGNGMLLSNHIRLIAAFDHRHIFLDPTPEAQSSFDERRRLFELPRSSWADYDTSLTSEGGGVWERTRKSVPISAATRAALQIDESITELSPPELMRAILTAPTDLLWNGGIGTYIKSAAESNADVGDKSNDAVRVNGADLRASVVGEGGNLGVTALGRIEYDMAGGRINTDAVDNSAGVDCSDHEVNIKILLDTAISSGLLAAPDRSALLASMTDEVGRLVLHDNIVQNELLGTSRANSPQMMAVLGRVIIDLEERRGLDRELEALPSKQQIAKRVQDGTGLTSPELATLMAHVKLALEADLLASELPDNVVYASRLPGYFPEVLREKYLDAINSHPLRRQLISTTLANEAIDCGGIAYVYRLAEDSGANSTDSIRAFTAATSIFSLGELWDDIRAADMSTAASDDLILETRRVLDRASRWLLTNRPQPIAVGAEISRYGERVRQLSPKVATWSAGHQASDLIARSADVIALGAPEDLARRVYRQLDIFCLLDVIDVADITDRDGDEVAELYYALDAHLGIDWLLSAVSGLDRGDRWHSLARLALRDDLYSSLRALTREVLSIGEPQESAQEKIADWESTNSSRLARARAALGEIAESGTLDLATLSVAARQVRSMVP